MPKSSAPARGASAHSNARKGIVEDCLSRKSRTTRKSMNVLPKMLNYASGFWAKLSRKSASYDSGVSKSCSLENWGNFESIISANSSFSKDRKSTPQGGLTPWNPRGNSYRYDTIYTCSLQQAEIWGWNQIVAILGLGLSFSLNINSGEIVHSGWKCHLEHNCRKHFQARI